MTSLVARGEHPLQHLHRLGAVGLPHQHQHAPDDTERGSGRSEVIRLDNGFDPLISQSGLDEIRLGDGVVGTEPDEFHEPRIRGAGAILPNVSPDITSPTNDRIKWLVRLRDRRNRDAEGVFVVEGERLYRRALTAGLIPEVTFVADPGIVETVGNMVTVERAVLDRASYRQVSEGVIAVFPQLDTTLEQLDLAHPPLVLIAENVEKPGNLGAMLRTVGAVGADALITVGESIDAHNPNVVRASTGALFTVPLATSNWDDLTAWLGEAGLEMIAATLSATDTVWETDLTGPVALTVGAEDVGLSDQALSLADRITLIPQATDTVDSLNVSVAAAILLFEARRQRS